MTTQYAICFDWPETPGEPCFAGLYKGTFGWAPTLDTAMTWTSEEDAERVLRNCYGTAAAEYGTVVEVGS